MEGGFSAIRVHSIKQKVSEGQMKVFDWRLGKAAGHVKAAVNTGQRRSRCTFNGAEWTTAFTNTPVSDSDIQI